MIIVHLKFSSSIPVSSQCYRKVRVLFLRATTLSILFRKFLMSSKGQFLMSSIFLYSATNWMLKSSSKGSSFYIFRHCDTFQNYHFFPSNYIAASCFFFSGPARYIRTFDAISKVSCVSLKGWSRRGSNILRYIRILILTGVFFILCDYFLVRFHLSPPFLLETKRFASIEDSRALFGTLRLTGDLFWKKNRIFSIFFRFFGKCKFEQNRFPSFKGNL